MKFLVPLLLTLPLSATEPLTSSANISLVPIPAGSFTIGSPDSEKGRSRNEAQAEIAIL